MQVKQIYQIMNTVAGEVLGKTALVKEDLTNIVDVGKLIVDSDNVDNYVKKLVNHIGKVVFVDRVYAGSAPSVMMDSWEFGSILEKVSANLPEAQESSTWNLTDGTVYTQDAFYKPSVSAKFFNSKVTFDIPMSFTERQVKESFTNVEQLNGFLTMLTVAVENSMTVKLDSLIMRTINNMIGQTIKGAGGWVPADATATPPVVAHWSTSPSCVNVLALYNETASTALSKDKAIYNQDFIRFATYMISMYTDRMTKVSTLFNVEGSERFTPKEDLRVVLLSDFSKASDTFLKSNSYNMENVALPIHDSVPYWQGSGLDYTFESTSSINVTTPEGDVNISGVVGVIFDKNSVGVTNLDRRVTTHYNAKAEFYTNFYKFDAGYYNDLSENFVVFFID